MFSIRIPFQNQTTTVKFSQARQSAHLRSKTKGLAFKYVTQGAEHYEIGQQQLILRSGEFMLLPQNCRFVAKAEPKRKPVRGICVDFLAEVDMLAEELSKSALLFAIPLPVSFLTSVKTVPQKASLISPSYGEELVAQLKVATGQLSTKVQQMRPILGGLVRKSSTQQQLFLRLELARQYVQAHYQKQLQLAKLGRIVGLSPHRLQRFFKEVYGQSPQQMQIGLRMEAARRLLAKPQHSLEQIAFQLGYTDLAAFSNQYLRTYHQRPSQARRQLFDSTQVSTDSKHGR
ncbi:MAG: AraC family transcriptional regulator [Bacteroidota bacterium]